MEDPQKYETPAERRSRMERQEPQIRDTGSEPGPDHRPTHHPTIAMCSPRPTATPTASTPGQMHSRIRELKCLVALLEGEMTRIATADIIEPAVWSSCALMLREVANRSLLLRQQALALAAEALGSGRQTLQPL